MHAHRNNGAAAPSLATPGAPGAVPPASEKASDTPHVGGPVQTKTECHIFEQPIDDGKCFATLRAQLALKGYGLSRTAADDGPVYFHVNRWGMVRALCDLAAVRAFAESVGARQ